MGLATRPRSIRRTPPVQISSRALRDTDNGRPRNSVVIADRNPVFLCGLATILETEGDFVVVASCRDEPECIKAVRALAPSLALLDISLSTPSGLQVVAAVKGEATGTRVVFLSSSVTANDVARALSMGASGILPKDSPPPSLVRWLRQVLSGRQLVPLATRITGSRNPQRSRMRGRPEETVVVLTPRERQIVELVSTGLSNREVAERLSISEGTIKVHLHHIFRKFSIRNRTALANMGRMGPEP
jgi:two-component system nitrate/nitrite response regulator NarL